MPACFKTFGIASIGAIPITRGSTPATAKSTRRAIGLTFNCFIILSLTTRTKAAPSLVCEELPAVTVPSFLKEAFKDKCLDDIKPLDIEKFKNNRLITVSPATVNRSLACLKSIFNRAIVWGRFEGFNPVTRVRMCKEKAIRLRYLEKEEIIRLITNCSDDFRPIVILAVNTGMRRGEILNLKWADIDFKRDVIYLLETKSDQKREVPINEVVKTTLIRVRKNPKSAYVFCYKNGDQVKDIRKSFFTALKKSAIKDFRFHDLRHCAASHLVMAGIDLNTVREILGHKTIEMTLRYAHLSPNHKKRAVDILGKSIGLEMPHSGPQVVPIWSPEQNSEIKQYV